MSAHALLNDPAARIRDAAAALDPALVALRRDLHAHPELAFEETRTAGIVAATGEEADRVRLMRGAPFLLVGFFVVAMMGVVAALPAHMVSLLREAGLPPAWVVVVPASIGVIQVIGRLGLFVLERQGDPHRANRLIPLLIPLGLAVLLASQGSVALALCFVLLFGLGNGMVTIVKGTAVAQYVSRQHVGALNGALGVPTALARASAPWLMGLLWSPQGGYTTALWGLVVISLAATLALWAAQRVARPAH